MEKKRRVFTQFASNGHPKCSDFRLLIFGFTPAHPKHLVGNPQK